MASIKDLKADKVKYRNDNVKCIEITNLLGHKYREVGRYNEAIDQHLEAISSCNKIKNEMISRESKAVSRRALGECYSEMGRHEEALDQHDLYLILALQLNDLIEIQRAHATIGRTYLLWALDSTDDQKACRAHLYKSEASFQKALQLCENLKSSGKLKCSKEYADMKSRLLLNLGLVYENLNDYNKCKKLLFDSIELTKKNFLCEDLFRCQISLGAIYEKSNSIEEAICSYEDALQTANSLKSKTKQFDALVCLGLILMKQENVPKARRYLKNAYYLKTPIEDDQQKIQHLLKVASVIRDDLFKLERCLKQNNDSDKLILLCDRLGDHFVELKCYSVAVKYYKKELYYATDLNKPDSVLAKIYVSIGQTYSDDGNFQEAIKYFTHEYNFNLGNKSEQCATLLKIADFRENLYAAIDELELEEKDLLKREIVQNYTTAMNLFEDNRLVHPSSLDSDCLDTSSQDSLDKDRGIITNQNNNDDDVDTANLRRELKLYIRTVRNYLHFLETNGLDLIQQQELKDNLSKYNDCDATEISDDEDEEIIEIGDSDAANTAHGSQNDNFYDYYNLDLLSSGSENGEEENDEEIPDNFRSRPKRNPKSTKVTNRLNQFGETPLHTACIAGNLGQVERLIEQKANLNAKDYCGWTPLHEASNHGHLQIVECLLKSGANIEACDDRSDCITPLHDACNCGNFGIIRLLLSYGANVLAINSHNETPVECLMSWRKRSKLELTKPEMDDCLQLENKIMNLMDGKGFDLSKLYSKQHSASQADNSTSNLSKESSKPIRQRNLIKDSIYLSENDTLYSKEVRSELGAIEDYDNPNTARKEYQITIDHLRRRPKSAGFRNPKLSNSSALVNEDEVAPRDDWLINDFELTTASKKKKSSKRDKDDFNSYNQYGSESKKRKSTTIRDISNLCKLDGENDSKYETDSGEPIEDESDDYNDYDVPDFDDQQMSTATKLTTTIECAEHEEDSGYDLDSSKTLSATPVRRPSTSVTATSPLKPETPRGTKLVTVFFDDIEKSAFAVPITTDKLDCKWLIEELIKRYFRKYFIKPIISLETRNGAFLCEDDLVLNVIDSSDSLKASITSWTIDTADKRYAELCSTNQLAICSEIQSCLKFANLSGSFKLNNTFASAPKQIQAMFQSLSRQDIKEIDISFTNLLLLRDSYRCFQTLLTSISTLQVLNLSGVGFPVAHLIQLLNISPILRELDLSFNSIGDEHSYTLAQIVKLYEKLQHFNLCGCDLTENGIRNKLLLSAIENSRLQSLILDHNDIEVELVEKFKTLYVNKLFLKTL